MWIADHLLERMVENLIINIGDDESSSSEDSDEELITLPMDDVDDNTDFSYIAWDGNMQF